MKNPKLKFIACMIASTLFGCSDDYDSADPLVSLRIVNAIQDIGTVELRDLNGNVPVLNTTSLSYRANGRFAFTSGDPVNIMVVPESDTLNVVLNEIITFDNPGGLNTLFLYGDTLQVELFSIEQSFQNYQDSLFGVSFVHVADDTDAVSIRAIQLDTAGVSDTTTLSQSLAFQSGTSFSQFEATARIDSYTFQFVDADNNVLESTSIDPLRRRREKVFRNITYLLVGRSDNGSGSSTLDMVQYDNF